MGKDTGKRVEVKEHKICLYLFLHTSKWQQTHQEVATGSLILQPICYVISFSVLS